MTKTGFRDKNLQKRNVILEISIFISSAKLSACTRASLPATLCLYRTRWLFTRYIYILYRSEVRSGKPFSNKQPSSSAPQRILCKLTAKTDPLSTHVCILLLRLYFVVFIFIYRPFWIRMSTILVLYC